jgi:hypothetical protein
VSNPSKRKGSDAEIKLLAWLHLNGHSEAVRNPPGGRWDVGDLHAWVDCDAECCCHEAGCPIVIEVKNCANVAAAINDGLAELDCEMANAGATHGVLVVKRRGKGDPGDWLAVRLVRNDPELGTTPLPATPEPRSAK